MLPENFVQVNDCILFQRLRITYEELRLFQAYELRVLLFDLSSINSGLITAINQKSVTQSFFGVRGSHKH